MAEAVKIDSHSKCGTCNTTPAPDQIVQCFVCNDVFHAYCEMRQRDDNLCTKSMVKAFCADSTKGNFKFFCDPCVTNLENDLVNSEKQKVALLEKKVQGMEDKLDKIVGLVEKSMENSIDTQPFPNNVWDNQQKMEMIKAPPQRNVLVVKSSPDKEQNKVTRAHVEKSICENKIPVDKTFESRNGNLVVICENEEGRDQLKNSVTSKDEGIQMSTPAPMKASITIVGLHRAFSKDEIMDMLVLENGYINKFARSNDIKEHCEIHSIQPLKNNAERFQAFVSVSVILREGILHHDNRLTLGLQKCKIYDRYHVKRCNNCQKFGHYAKECPTPDMKVCGKCSSHQHNTTDCDNELNPECINCIRAGHETNTNHTTNSHQCPVLCNQQEAVKKNHLNMRRSHRAQQW